MPSLRERLFGKSRLDQVLDILREDRAAMTGVMTRFMDAQEAIAALSTRQFDLLTAPVGTPTEVILRTPSEEAMAERTRKRAKAHGLPESVTLPDDLLSAFAQDFLTTPPTFDRAS